MTINIDIGTIIGLLLAVPGALLTCLQINDRYVLLRKDNYINGINEKSINKNSKPILSFFGRVLLRKLPTRKAKRDAQKIAEILKKEYFPTIIIGIGRGGSIFGAIISYNLYQVPLLSIDRAYDWQKERKDIIMFDYEIPPRFLDRVLLVAGEVHSGNTMRKFISYLNDMGAREIKTCAFYQEMEPTWVLDYNRTFGSGRPFMPWQEKNYYRDSLSSDTAKKLNDKRLPLTTEVKRTIFIVRHGETEQNSKDIFIGSSTDNVSLNEKGKEQASTAGIIIKNALNGAKATIHSSPQQRCLQTASLINVSIESNVNTSQELQERNYGLWEGKKRSSLARTNEYHKYVLNPMKFCPPEAESIQKNISRVLSFWNNEIMADSSDIAHVIITHKTTGRILLSYLLNSPYSRFREIKIDNDSVIKITIVGHETTCEYLR